MPSSDRLLGGVRAALSALAESCSTLDDRARQTLRSADVILNELQLRQDHTFLVGLFAELRRAAQRGVELSGEGAAALAEMPESIAPGTAYDLASVRVEAVLQVLANQVHALRAIEEDEARQFVKQAIDLESKISWERLKQGAVPPPPSANNLSAQMFEAYLSRKFPAERRRVTSFRELVEGYQKTTVLVTTRDVEGHEQELVIRAEKREVFLRLDGGKVAAEFEIIACVREAGIKTAEPLWLENDPTELGQSFIVSRCLPGINPGNPLNPQPVGDAAARAIVQTLARIHAVPLSDKIKSSPLGHWLDYSSLKDNTLAAVESWKNQLWAAQSNASIATVRLYDWLVANVPVDDLPPRLLHVDYGPHNLLLDGDEVTGVLDWESARIGDPAEDLSDLLGRFQGKIDRDQAIAWYKEAGGSDISEYRLRYFDAFNNMKTLVAPPSAAAMFEQQAETPLYWAVMPLLYGAVSRGVEDKIAAAEAAARRS